MTPIDLWNAGGTVNVVPAALSEVAARGYRAGVSLAEEQLQATAVANQRDGFAGWSIALTPPSGAAG